MSVRAITLRNIRNELGSRYLTVTLKSDGGLVIEGHDLGAGVEKIFGPGNREYEWAWTIQADEVTKLISALAGDNGSILEALASRFSNDAAAELKQFLDNHGIQYNSWSRIGD